MVTTVRDLLGDVPAMEFDWDFSEAPDPKQIWANYDSESDSFILYTIGKPRGGIHVYVGDDMYAIVDRKTKKAIGFYVENWERNFVPAHKELQEAWAGIKPNSQETLIMLLRMLALWLLMSLGSSDMARPARLQPA